MNTIGKLAKAAGVGIETIRFYEKRGLIKQPKKLSDQSFRIYPLDTIALVRFIKTGQSLGFTLKEIQEFLELNRFSVKNSHVGLSRIQKKITEIEDKISQLKKIKSSLKKMESSLQNGTESIDNCYFPNL